MSNMPDINSKRVHVTISLTLYAQLMRFANEHKLSLNDAVRLVFARQLETIQLKPEDLIWIANQIKVNEEKRKDGTHE